MHENKQRSQKGLGKGLSALIAEINVDTPEATSTVIDHSNIAELPVDQIDPSPYQPRKYFSEDALRELTESIRKNGVMQPIIVRVKGGRYELVAGERRWRASKLARIDAIPVLVKDLSDTEALEFALIENIQRQDLTPLEEAEGYRRIMDECSYTQEELASELGKSRSHIANMLRLLNLPENVKKALDEGNISMGHARALLGKEDSDAIVDAIIKRQLSVRQTEQLIKKGNAPENSSRKSASRSTSSRSPALAKEKDEDIINLEQMLSESLGLQVSIEDEGSNGRLIVAFNNLEQLDRVLQKLS